MVLETTQGQAQWRAIMLIKPAKSNLKILRNYSKCLISRKWTTKLTNGMHIGQAQLLSGQALLEFSQALLVFDQTLLLLGQSLLLIDQAL